MKIEAPLLTLGSDPEPQFNDDSKLMVKLNLAENHNRNVGTRDKPEWKRTGTSWYGFVAFGDTAEKILNELEKGDGIRLLKGFHRKKNIGDDTEPDVRDQYVIYEYEKYDKK